MFRVRSLYASALALAYVVGGATVPSRPAGPSVTIRNGTVIGRTNNSVDSFFGIPYVQPPVGNLRLRAPQTLKSSFGELTLPEVATACSQMEISTFDSASYPAEAQDALDTLFHNYSLPQGEDCLTVTVQRPANLASNARLPVLFWIYGGGFEIGSTAEDNGASLVARSMNLSMPVVFVEVNYRGNTFGFLPGKQLQQEGNTNLGLRDQRKGLEWVAENIAAFGGDPNRVTIWGESAGAVSVFDQLLINNGDHKYRGKPLFRAAIMDSGSTLRTFPVNSSKAQGVFDAIAAAAGCKTSPDVLHCLRAAPYAVLKKAASCIPDFLSYDSLNIFYYRRPDPSSSFYANTAAEALSRGAFARVPIIMGNQEDEGTIFSLQQTNLSTTADLIDYYTKWFPITPRAKVAGLVATYPDNPSAGSPFRTGTANNEPYPQYKRNAALMGDYVLTLAARETLAGFAARLPGAWAYLATYLHGFPLLGTFHASDVLATFGVDGRGGSTQDAYYFNFVYSLDPNGKGLRHWPRWDNQGLRMLNISANGTEDLRGDFRWESYRYLVDNPESFFLETALEGHY